MTDYAVQNNGQSALAWGATGAVAGAGTGAALAKWANVGIPTQAYKSWDEAVAAVNKDDKFIKKQIEKGGEKATNWTKLQENADVLKTAKDNILQNFPEDIRNNADVDKYINELAKFDEIVKEEADKVLAKLNTGETINGLDKSSATLSADVITYVKENIDPVKSQKELLDTAEANVKKLAGVTDDVLKNVSVENYVQARKHALANLGDDVLKTLKKPSMKWTALVGAAVAATLALIAKPKNKEV